MVFYLLLPLFALVIAGFSFATHSVAGFILGILFTWFGANEWRAYWKIRDNRQRG